MKQGKNGWDSGKKNYKRTKSLLKLKFIFALFKLVFFPTVLAVNNFSRRAFVETAQASAEIQQMISEAANDGQEITRRQVRRLTDELTSVTSPLLPEEIREKTQTN